MRTRASRTAGNLGTAAITALMLASLGACGGPPPVVETPKPDPKPVATAKPPADAGKLQPLAEPKNLLFYGKWRSPMKSLTTLAGCAGVPESLVKDGLGLAAFGAVRDLIDDREKAGEIAQLVSLDASIDFAGVLDAGERKRDVWGAFSIGLTSLERARAAADSGKGSVEIAPGVFRIGGDPEEGRKRWRSDACAVTASLGTTPARLICADSEENIVQLAAYLARGLSQLETKTDFHAEFRSGPIVDKVGDVVTKKLDLLPEMAKGVQLGEPLFDKAIVDAATGVSGELKSLLADFDKATIDVTADATDCLKATAGIDFKSAKSLTAQELTDRPERGGPPPALFLKLPSDVGSASFSRGTDPARYAGVRQTIHDLALGAMNKFAIGTPADRKLITDVLLVSGAKDVPIVYGSGSLPKAAAPTTPPKVAPKPVEPKIGDIANEFLGWSLVGIGDKSDKYVKAISDLVAGYNAAAVKRSINAAMKDAGLKKEMQDALPKVKINRAPAGLPKGTVELELKMDITIKGDYLPPPPVAVAPPGKGPLKPPPPPRRAPDKKETLTMYVIVMPDGDTTWEAFGGNRAELVRRLNMVKGTPAADKTLASRAGLDALKTGKAMSGGFASIGGAASGAVAAIGATMTRRAGGMPRRGPDPMAMIAGVFAAMPNKGETPIIWQTRASATAPIRSEVSVNVPKGVFADVGSVVNTFMPLLGGMMGGGRSRSTPAAPAEPDMAEPAMPPPPPPHP